MTMGNRLKFLLPFMLAIPITLLVITVALARAPDTTLASHPSPPVRASSLALPPKPTPEPGLMMAPNSRLAAPPMSDPPTQVELGHRAYWMSCMVCHGDRGQGLTDEWRTGALDPEDQNCWQSKCHAPNHPPEGFEIPRNAPPVIGAGTLGAYQTAADLYEYLRVKMPWSYPGILEDEEYWQLTAFLADANQVSWGEKPLSPHDAANVLLLPQLVQTHHSAVEIERVVTVAVLALLLGTTILQRWTRAR